MLTVQFIKLFRCFVQGYTSPQIVFVEITISF